MTTDTTSSSNNNNNSANKNLPSNSNNNNNSSPEGGAEVSESEVEAGDSETESDVPNAAPRPPPESRVLKSASDRPSSSGVESPHDVDLNDVIKIPEVSSSKKSIVEVLSQVVKLERSSSSSASELTRTPEAAPDIVTSTTKGRARKAAPPKRAVGGERRSADVATLAILCQHYAQLVHALKVRY